MSQAALLSVAIYERLKNITTANGYHTNITQVYGVQQNKPDSAKPPYILMRIGEDRLTKRLGDKSQRAASYAIEGVLGRIATLGDLQKLHHDILKALCFGAVPLINQQRSEWLGEESAEFDPPESSGAPGSTVHSVVCTLEINYIENY